MNEIILASASIGRKKLFDHYFTSFRTYVSDIDESRITAPNAVVLTEKLAILKAKEVSKISPDVYFFGFDRVVTGEDRFLGNPADTEEAKKILRFLSGKNQLVHSGYSIIQKSKGIEISGVGETVLFFKELSGEFINHYVMNHPVTRFAGGYGVQDNDNLIDIISGDMDTVVGAPMTEVIGRLREIGMPDSLIRKDTL
jgi:septum formation protein